MTTCPACGHEVFIGQAICPNCGLPLKIDWTTGRTLPPPPSAVELSGVRWLRVFAILLLAVTSIGAVGTLLSTGATTLSDLALPLAVGVVATVCQVACSVSLLLALRDFSRVDRSRFRIPMVLTIFFPVGLAVALVGFSLLLMNGVSGILDTPTYAFDLSIASAGAVIGLLGYAGGTLGIWWLGTRYNDTMVKIAAIAFLSTFDNLVSYLTIVGAAVVVFAMVRLASRLAKIQAVPGSAASPPQAEPHSVNAMTRSYETP